MSIPSTDKLREAILLLASDGEEHKLEDAKNWIQQLLNISDEDRNSIIYGNGKWHKKFNHQVQKAKDHFISKGLFNRTRDGYFEITEDGKKCYKQLIDQITMKQFEQEGSKRLVSHIKIERSPNNRALAFLGNSNPEICEYCGCNTQDIYKSQLLITQAHHVVPLSMGEQIPQREDFRILCPNCHTALHCFLREYLEKEKKNNFTRDEAHKAHEDFRKNLKTNG